MSTKVEGTYRNAPIEVTTKSGRYLYFEVDNDGSIEVTAEIPDGYNPVDVAFYLTPEDWTAVVQHIDRDQLRLRGEREAKAS